MAGNSKKRQAKLKAGIPSALELEIAQEWSTVPDNLIYYGDTIAIRSWDGSFWKVDLNNEKKLMSTAKEIGRWELVKIVAENDEFSAQKERPVKYGETIALRFTVNSAFTSTNLNDKDGLIAEYPWCKEWERFVLMPCPDKYRSRDKKLRYGSFFSLKACNDKFVMFDLSDSKRLIAYANEIDEWETFVVINPSDPR